MDYGDIAIADNTIREAYTVAAQMYKPQWGWKDNVNHLTEEKLSIVYAFNVAECLRDSILNSNNHKETIKKEVSNLMHTFLKKERYEVQWIYQRNTILGILYYLLSFSDGIVDEDLESLKDCARHWWVFPNDKGMVFLNDFIKAAENRKDWFKNHENDDTDTQEVQLKELNRHMALVVFNTIFKHNLDMDKIDKALRHLLTIKTTDGKRMLIENKYWFVVFQWFLEIGFIEKQRTGAKFREWLQYLYGERGFSTTSQFDEAKRVCKGLPSLWKSLDVPDDFIAIRDKLSVVFAKNKRVEYHIDGQNIIWDIDKETGKASIEKLI